MPGSIPRSVIASASDTVAVRSSIRAEENCDELSSEATISDLGRVYAFSIANVEQQKFPRTFWSLFPRFIAFKSKERLSMDQKTRFIAVVLGLALVVTPHALGGSADLKINVTVTPQNAQIGDIIQYHCVVTNLGPDTPSSLHDDAGPDNSGGGCNPANPSISCDKYTNFDHSNPTSFFTDSTNFRYFRVIDSNGQTVSTLAAGQSGYFDVFYKATANGTLQRLVGGHSDDQSVTDPNPSNNDTTVTSP